MATGGPEQCKLLKELYLDKRFESRWKVLNEEAHLAVDNYQVAVLTRNPVLLACAESVVCQMSSPDTVTRVFGTRIVSDTLVPPDSEVDPGTAVAASRDSVPQ
jgi:hypothetical protein